ncbi:hypothetical protein GLOTRDRAFT_94262 [Gloeophyllum trabeum ATCC 11539]|uniref:F-box domain-containing protein n=1 Tax=Gloeophyllum trabeum (strain ATCC 11539 / FP-39264 / Madison 617) TaxID=670483 RepID=S7Q5Y8_GLOTA|nr:uncharacterized protein GLOTRDRAFT_94262 [Gloeophyllum trabeum ATCC 11539]EPQ54878.1 hypothetical protein GLOTRDRAFT_94262 [Gloeophyllum trabeum ATCC 11539]
MTFPLRPRHSYKKGDNSCSTFTPSWVRSGDEAGHRSFEGPLPHDVLLLIVKSMLPISMSQDISTDFTQGRDNYWSTLMDATRRREQALLLPFLQVCRQWYLSATALLYDCPIVTSYEQVRRLARTLKRHPSLAILVREVRVLDKDTWKVEATITSLVARLSGRQALNYRLAIDSLLVSCGAVEKLTLRPSYHVQGRLDGLHQTFRQWAWPKRLTVLSLWGSSARIVFKDKEILFPVLRDLTIRGVKIDSQFSKLPGLRTLRIQCCHLTSSVYLPVTRLATLEFMTSRIDSPYHSVSRVIQSAYNRSLEALVIEGPYQDLSLLAVVRTVDCSLLHGLKRLVLSFDFTGAIVPYVFPREIGRLPQLTSLDLIWLPPSLLPDVTGLIMDSNTLSSLEVLKVVFWKDIRELAYLAEQISVLESECADRGVACTTQTSQQPSSSLASGEGGSDGNYARLLNRGRGDFQYQYLASYGVRVWPLVTLRSLVIARTQPEGCTKVEVLRRGFSTDTDDPYDECLSGSP